MAFASRTISGESSHLLNMSFVIFRFVLPSSHIVEVRRCSEYKGLCFYDSWIKGFKIVVEPAQIISGAKVNARPAGRIGHFCKIDKFEWFSAIFEDEFYHSVDVSIANGAAADTEHRHFRFSNNAIVLRSDYIKPF